VAAASWCPVLMDLSIQTPRLGPPGSLPRDPGPAGVIRLPHPTRKSLTWVRSQGPSENDFPDGEPITPIYGIPNALIGMSDILLVSPIPSGIGTASERPDRSARSCWEPLSSHRSLDRRNAALAGKQPRRWRRERYLTVRSHCGPDRQAFT
jgi:hypothetical protein